MTPRVREAVRDEHVEPALDVSVVVLDELHAAGEALGAGALAERVDGDRVDATTYSLLSVSKRGETLTPYEQEERDNEAKRRIRIIPTRFLPSIEQAIKTLYR